MSKHLCPASCCLPRLKITSGMALLWILLGLPALAQQTTTLTKEKSTAPPTEGSQPPAKAEVSEEQVYQNAYRKFHENYKLGPNDELAIRVLGEPEYSLEKVKISPVGRIYHPLLGDVEVAGRTVPQLTQELVKELSEYLLNPKVSISLLETKSAKIGVVGEVMNPGILVMAEPMRVLDAIKAAGGFSDFGSKSNVIVYRQLENGNIGKRIVNIAKLLEGKATAQENVELQPNDMVEVQGNTKKRVALITSLSGISNFMNVMGRGGR